MRAKYVRKISHAYFTDRTWGEGSLVRSQAHPSFSMLHAGTWEWPGDEARVRAEEVRQGQKVNELVFRYRLQEWFLAILLAIFELGDIDLLLYPPTIAH